MTSPTDEHLPPEPHEGLDASANAEARRYETSQTPSLARASDAGAPPTDAPAAGERPDVAGTGDGNPLAGVTISDEDAESAVRGDEGPEHPGVRRSS